MKQKEISTNKKAMNAVVEVFGSDSEDFSDVVSTCKIISLSLSLSDPSSCPYVQDNFDVEVIDAIESKYEEVAAYQLAPVNKNISQPLQQTSKVQTPRGKWTCTTCTLHNDSFRTKCSVCGSAAPKGVVSSKSNSSSWPIGYSKAFFVEKKKKKASAPPKSLSSFRFGESTGMTTMTTTTTMTTKTYNTHIPKLGKKQSKLCNDVANNHWTLSLSFPKESSEICPVKLNETMVRTYVYPTNMQVREYQMEAVQAALFQNTLVVLPTGLGKTFIAAVVMYNYFRW